VVGGAGASTIEASFFTAARTFFTVVRSLPIGIHTIGDSSSIATSGAGDANERPD
jgi:hypothetical protein